MQETLDALAAERRLPGDRMRVGGEHRRSRRRREAVWDVIADPSNYLHFMSGVTRWEVVGDAAARASAPATGCCCASARPRSAG